MPVNILRKTGPIKVAISITILIGLSIDWHNNHFFRIAGFEVIQLTVIVNWLLVIVEGDYLVHVLSKIYLNQVSWNVICCVLVVLALLKGRLCV